MCIEQELHRPPPPSRKVGLLQDQLQRRVFWDCYMIDRYSSITLSRPFALGDKRIEISFPVDANDEEIEAAEASGAFPDLDSFGSTSSIAAESTRATRTTELSIFFACLKLRQITSKIHTSFSGKRMHRDMQNDTTTRGMVYSNLDNLLKELEKWRSYAPIFPYPQNLYQMKEWYDLLLLRERLLLIRKTIDIVPKQDNMPPRDLLFLCLECAVGAITCFCRLFEQQAITFTRSYFQMLFTAGLSVMLCLSVVKDFDQILVQSSIDAVIAGEDALKKMSKELPDAKRYVAVYEALRLYIIRKYSRQSHAGSMHNIHHSAETRNGLFQSARSAPVPNSTGRYGQYDNQNNDEISGIVTGGTDLSPDSHAHSSLHMSFNDSAFTPDMIAITQCDTSISEGSILSWNVFEDNMLWDVEAGLNEYAYGDPPLNLSWNDSYDLPNMW